MSDVFISYSRKDKAFVEHLYQALKEQGRETWVDWHAIEWTEDWWQAIQRGIEGTNTFVFVLSPNSVESAVCRDEINHAVKHNKRLIPIVYQPVEAQQVHEALGKLNWLFFCDADRFVEMFGELVRSIDMDLEYVKGHTRLLEKAIEWNQQTRNESFLLRGVDLQTAEAWLVKGASKQPQPTQLQGEYISASRAAEIQRQQAEARRQQVFMAGVGMFAFLAFGAAAVAVQQRQVAERRGINAELNAQSLTAINLLESNLGIEALVEGLKAGQKLKSATQEVEPETAMRVVSALRQIVYSVHEQNRLEGHGNTIESVSFSPDGKTIATGSWDNTVKLWNLKGEELKTLKGHRDVVRSVSFSPDGKTIATGSEDATIKLWNLEGKELKTLKGHGSHILCVSFSPDGKTIVTGSGDRTAKLWNLEGKELKTLKGHDVFVASVSFSPDGKTIVTGSGDTTAKLWNLEGKELKTLKGHRSAVKSVNFSPDGKTIATGSEDYTAKLWNLEGKELKTLKGHSGYITSVSFSPDGKTIATGSWDDTVKLWNLEGRN
ncbi:toll/interleukin-1 receptor domain-containing protein [Leptolyngbya sp. GGD]|uniref:toll/interleukin-1 receptor domain-containing protein n=1 Tax=Leptolyngbya sp. GGD TaxID=2997907 RepID=UPI00227AA645|nr:TIR domain-containing protein [Leptolyngbya sp. GGD]MCY6488960.1 TIR domain-containing protein [Leptolyngbya sp. GGD]